MSHTFTVKATLQSPDNEPVEVTWYKGHDALQATLAAGQLLGQLAAELLNVRIDVDVVAQRKGSEYIVPLPDYCPRCHSYGMEPCYGEAGQPVTDHKYRPRSLLPESE